MCQCVTKWWGRPAWVPVGVGEQNHRALFLFFFGGGVLCVRVCVYVCVTLVTTLRFLPNSCKGWRTLTKGGEPLPRAICLWAPPSACVRSDVAEAVPLPPFPWLHPKSISQAFSILRQAMAKAVPAAGPPQSTLPTAPASAPTCAALPLPELNRFGFGFGFGFFVLRPLDCHTGRPK